jgi:hypothetical protein
MTPKQCKAMFRRLAEFRFTPSDMIALANIQVMERKKGFIFSYGPDGEQWAPLKAATIRRKSGEHSTTRARKGVMRKTKARNVSIAPDKPLIDSGQLMTPGPIRTRDNEARIPLAQSRKLPVWKRKSISDIHNEGSGRIPKREHWGFYKDARKNIRAMAGAIFARFVKTISGGYK